MFVKTNISSISMTSVSKALCYWEGCWRQPLGCLCNNAFVSICKIVFCASLSLNFRNSNLTSLCGVLISTTTKCNLHNHISHYVCKKCKWRNIVLNETIHDVEVWKYTLSCKTDMSLDSKSHTTLTHHVFYSIERLHQDWEKKYSM